MSRLRSLILLAAVLPSVCFAAAPPSHVVVPMHMVTAEGVGKSIGAITIEQDGKNLKFIPKLEGLPAGERGFHLHQNPSCDAKEKDGKMSAAEAAGPHFDPHKTGHHLGPDGNGHVGDLPKLVVGADGTANTVIESRKLTMADVLGHSLMIHAGGDNYSDTPAPLGGGGARIACGVIPEK